MDHGASAAARTIAAGGNPNGSETFTHPRLGELTFKWRMPLAVDSLRHSVEMDNLLQDLSPSAEPSFQTRVTAAAIAGLTVPPGNNSGKALMVDLPVVDEHVEDDGDDGERTVRTYYNAPAEQDLEFLTRVWLAFSAWRGSILNDGVVARVGESSGGPSTS